MTPVFHVCVPNTNRDYFDYHASDEQPVIGGRVWIPFGKKTRLGITIRKADKTDPNITIKPIKTVIDNAPLIPAELLQLCHWVAGYYQAPLASVIGLALPKNLRAGKTTELPSPEAYQLACSTEKAHETIKKTAYRQHELIEFLSEQTHPTSKKTLLKAGFSNTQLTALLTQNLLKQVAPEEVTNRTLQRPLPLNAEQTIAVERICDALTQYHCFLLQGITGSGKTEVYLQVIPQVLKANQQILILVPEIGLTPQLVNRFHNRFQEKIVVIHSHLNDSERQHAWLEAYHGNAQIIIGTRAAVFTPLPKLGLIIIDEEHDASLKQMKGVRYSARDTALMRAYHRGVPIILGSATPSLESLANSQNGKYTLLNLTQRPLSTIPLRYQIVDIRNVALQEGLAPKSIKTIGEHLARGEQVLIFINRRGFSPVLLCHACGWMADCQACDSHLTLHRSLGQLICHHCGRVQRIHTHCSHCKATELLPIGSGTQRVHEFLVKQFPEKPVLRIDRDTTGKKDALANQLDKIATGEAQLIVGTQMLAKGHHFPNLSLVVILDADAGFYNQDFRAIESLGQLITQVAGRAGRENLAGHVMIQTHLPQHPLLNTLIQSGYQPFANELLTVRKQAKLPPYNYLALIRAQGRTSEKVLQFLHRLKTLLPQNHLEIMGPAPAPLARKARQYRMQLLLKSPSRNGLQKSLTQLRQAIKLKKIDTSIRWNIDVDPMDLS